MARRRRWVIAGGAVLVGLTLLAVADRVGQSVTESRIADALKRSYGLPRAPHVTIAGFPFLDQAATGTYQRVEARVPVWTGQRQNVELTNLRITFRGASFSLGDLMSGSTAPQAESSTATAVVPYVSLAKHFFWGVTAIKAEGTMLHITGVLQGPLYNVNIDEVAIPVFVKGSGIQINPFKIHEDQPKDAPGLSSELLQQRLTALYPLTALPGTTALDRIDISPAGLVLHSSS